MSFRMMSFMHETLYGLFRDPFKSLHAAGLEAGHHVLEVGCGPGFFTVPAAQIVGEGGRVLALDINPLAVEHVRKKIEAAGISNAKTLVADAGRTNLPDQNFDLAFVFGFGHAVGGMDKIWPELYRLLKPGGILAVEGHHRPPGELFDPVGQQARISRFKKIE
jgi:ubiquinone/menaquinone biosynthesis C-methylase UbiE